MFTSRYERQRLSAVCRNPWAGRRVLLSYARDAQARAQEQEPRPSPPKCTGASGSSLVIRCQRDLYQRLDVQSTVPVLNGSLCAPPRASRQARGASQKAAFFLEASGATNLQGYPFTTTFIGVWYIVHSLYNSNSSSMFLSQFWWWMWRGQYDSWADVRSLPLHSFQGSRWN